MEQRRFNGRGVVALSFCALLLGNGCNQKKESFEALQPRKKVQESFSIQKIAGDSQNVSTAGSSSTATGAVQLNPLNQNKAQVSLNKQALDKEFLLQVEMITQHPIPRFSSLQSRVIMFRQKGDQLYIVESSRGQNFGKGMHQDLLIAELPIVKEDETQLTFDFNKGMKKIFTASDWTGRDQAPDNPFESVKFNFSYIDSAEFSQSNKLVIRQVAQMQSPASATYAVVYYLSPYLPNPAFKPTVAPRNYDRMGFFEVAPTVNAESGTTAYASKQDISKPIVYAISSNTPAEFRQAVRDGVLYWNKAFGKNIVQVIDAPNGVQAPNPDYNIVQWVDWDSAGMAYADAQMDPLTGEITHQQVYFTSAWARIGKLNAQKLVRLLNAHEAEKKNDKLGLSLKGFKNQVLCEMDMADALTPEIAQTLLKDTDPAKILKASQDLLREVVAHEVGHTLGLRHNFAGSTAVNYTLDSRMDLFKKYVETGSTPDRLVPTSSVMDYNLYPEGMMVGDLIAKAPQAQDYDTKAIRTLFLGQSFRNDELPLFCTDSHIGSYLDCNTYDAGASYVEWVKYNGNFNLNSMPRTILETYIAAKNPPYGAQSISVPEVALDTKNYLAPILMSEAMFLSLFQKDILLLKTARAFPSISSSNIALARNKTIQYLLSEINRHGELDKIFINSRAGLAKALKKQFFELVNQNQNTSGVGPDGKPFSFSQEELAQMKVAASAFFDKLEEDLIMTEVSLLARVPAPTKLDISPLSDNLLPYLARREKAYVLETTGRVMSFQKVIRASSEWSVPPGTLAPKAEQDKKDVMTITLPEFAYPFEVRKIAASFLSPARTTVAIWGLNEKLAIQKDFLELVNKSIPPAAQQIKLQQAGEYPQEMIQWLFEASAISSLLQ